VSDVDDSESKLLVGGRSKQNVGEEGSCNAARGGAEELHVRNRPGVCSLPACSKSRTSRAPYCAVALPLQLDPGVYPWPQFIDPIVHFPLLSQQPRSFLSIAAIV
jgi:hypothetical protein